MHSICSSTKPIAYAYKTLKRTAYTCAECPFRCGTATLPVTLSIRPHITVKIGHLNEHARLHAGVREFKCALCTWSSRSGEKLIEHERLHRVDDDDDLLHTDAHHSNNFTGKQTVVYTVEQLADQLRAAPSTLAERPTHLYRIP